MGDFVSILIENLILMQGATKQVSETKERNELHLGKKNDSSFTSCSKCERRIFATVPEIAGVGYFLLDPKISSNYLPFFVIMH